MRHGGGELFQRCFFVGGARHANLGAIGRNQGHGHGMLEHSGCAGAGNSRRQRDRVGAVAAFGGNRDASVHTIHVQAVTHRHIGVIGGQGQGAGGSGRRGCQCVSIVAVIETHSRTAGNRNGTTGRDGRTVLSAHSGAGIYAIDENFHTGHSHCRTRIAWAGRQSNGVAAGAGRAHGRRFGCRVQAKHRIFVDDHAAVAHRVGCGGCAGGVGVAVDA